MFIVRLYKIRLMLCTALLFPFICHAQFDITGQAELILSNGNTQKMDYGFRYFRQDGSYHFIVGEHKLIVPSVPQKYSLALILQQKTQVWVPDFSKEPVQSFTFNIAGSEISLRHDPAVDSPGNFIVQLNSEIYHFNRGPGQINFYFTEEGISEIKIEGMLKPKK